MKNLLKAAAVLSSFAVATLPVRAEVTDDLHAKCIAAADYAGCISAHQGKANSLQVDQGFAQVGGNSCPSGYAFIGGGYCKRVGCWGQGLWGGGGHHPDLGGKNWACDGNGRLTFWEQEEPVRTFVDENCPTDMTWEIGWQSTCKQAKGPV